MWNRGKEIVRILNLIVETPNLRSHPTDSTIKLFDGGQVSVMTGLTRYEFNDGSSAFHGLHLPWELNYLTINLATSEKITIEVSPTKPPPNYQKPEELLTPTVEIILCPNCYNQRILQDRYCRYCGQDLKIESNL